MSDDTLRIPLRLDLTPGGVVSAEAAALLVTAIEHQAAQLATVIAERDILAARADAALVYIRDPFSPSPAAAWVAFLAACGDGAVSERAQVVLDEFRAIESEG